MSGNRVGLRLLLVATATAVAYLTVACGGGRTPPGVIQGATAADREFLDGMAVLLESARESAAQATVQANRSELKEYARRAHDDHARQVSAVRSLDQTLFGHETAGFGAMPLQVSPGPNFDREWITEMMDLHQLAVDVAATRLKERGDPQAEALARQLHAAEGQELERLRAWSKQWFGAGS